MIHPLEAGSLGLSAKAYRAIFPVVLIAVALSLVAHFLLLKFEFSALIAEIANSFITALVAFSAHNFVLSGGVRRGLGALRSDHPKAFSAFVALGFFIILAIFGIGWIVHLAVGNPSPATLASQTVSSIATLFVIVFTVAFAALLIFSAFATMFPAIVDGGDASPKAAWKRGVTGAIALRIIGTIIVSIVLLYLIVSVLFPLVGTPREISLSVPRQLFLEAITLLANFYITTLTATILSKAYLGSYTQAEP